MFSISAFFALFTLTVLMIPATGGNDSFGSVSINNNTSPITLSVLQQPKTHKYTLVAEETTLEMAPGVRVDAWTYNGTLPGPTLKATEGYTSASSFNKFVS
jgi:FtsP/CotA-like multicopper oxidase with cupredoxin domain